MFYKTKKKLDSRIRFQNSRFKNRLQLARSYKRSVRARPETDWDIFLSKIGLGTWLARFLSLLVLLCMIYLIYVPNFFFIKHINITGADDAAKINIESTINSFLGKELPWPQKNLLLLSKAKLTNYLLKNNRQVMKVNSLRKKLPNSLNLDVVLRFDEFLIQTPISNYIVSNDGFITNQLIAGASATLPSNLAKILLKSSPGLAAGQEALAPGKTEFIGQLRIRLPDIIKSPVQYYEIADLQAPDLSANTKNGFRVVFDFNSKVSETLDRLKFLISQLQPIDLKRLYYIDMRFENKSYLCYKATACVKDTNLPGSPATSTPDNLPN